MRREEGFVSYKGISMKKQGLNLSYSYRIHFTKVITVALRLPPKASLIMYRRSATSWHRSWVKEILFLKKKKKRKKRQKKKEEKVRKEAKKRKKEKRKYRTKKKKEKERTKKKKKIEQKEKRK